jgi:hypothetical protein
MARIPAILHQTWKTKNVPEEWQRLARSWQTLNPSWHYHLWTDEANRAFVAEHYAQLLATYDGYPYAIQRADAVRYCLLHHYGGVYADLDIECLRPIDGLMQERRFIAVLEPDVQAIDLGFDRVVSNAILAAAPAHPFLAFVIDTLSRDCRRAVTHRDVLETTGPLMLSRALQRYLGDLDDPVEAGVYGDMTVLLSVTAFPLVNGEPELDHLRINGGDAEAVRRRLVQEGAYAVHYWANSWVGTLAGELVNPEPFIVPGFTFYPGLDSPGNDIANVGRVIPEAAKACLETPGAVAFNTDGMVKDRLLPPNEWLPMGNGATNEGLYVRTSGLTSRLRLLFDRSRE